MTLFYHEIFQQTECDLSSFWTIYHKKTVLLVKCVAFVTLVEKQKKNINFVNFYAVILTIVFSLHALNSKHRCRFVYLTAIIKKWKKDTLYEQNWKFSTRIFYLHFQEMSSCLWCIYGLIEHLHSIQIHYGIYLTRVIKRFEHSGNKQQIAKTASTNMC